MNGPATDPARRLSPVVRVAPAKLNLTLAIVGRRPDGYHVLHSVFVPLALADRLSLSQAGTGPDSLHVAGFDAGPLEGNLVLRAIAATRSAVGGGWPGGPSPAPSLSARLEKHIPVAAGLAGGSSDAAAAMDGSLEAWGTELVPSARHAIAARLGSDVPFFLSGSPALVEGRGESVVPLLGLRDAPGVLLVTPAIPVATAEVFAVFDGLGGRGSGSTRMSSAHLAEELRAGLSAADLVARAGALTVANDLLQAALGLVPELVPFRRGLSRLLARPVGLSGSGPTLWALYPSEALAAVAADAVRVAVRDGRLPAPGAAAPFVTATTILTGRHEEQQP